MADQWCGSCGSDLLNLPHCSKCGAKATIRNLDPEKIELLNYSQFKTQKSGERDNHSKGKKIPSDNKTTNSKSDTFTSKEVSINVGIIEENKDDNLVKKRGSKLPILVMTDDGGEEVLRKALKKIVNTTNIFVVMTCTSCVILTAQWLSKLSIFPYLPFTVEGYKVKLGKPYSKIEFGSQLTPITYE